MKVTAISDMHGIYKSYTIPESDILCICGDIVPLRIQSSTESSIKWFAEEFLPWCVEQPVDHVYFIAGNHDWFLQRTSLNMINKYCEIYGKGKVTYLIDQAAKYEKDGQTYNIYGTPWCHQFGYWAFMIPDDEMREKFKKIPENTDILLSHDAPFGRTDLLMQSPYHLAKGHIGNEPMRERLEEISPKLHFTGHLHSCNHVPTEYNNTTTVCVSMLDEDYRCVYEPFTISI